MSGKARVLTILLLLATEASAGVIRGRVRVPKEQPVSQGGAQASVGGAEEAVVWVDSLPPKLRKRHARESPVVRVVQSGRRFRPRVTAVSAGTSIRFLNRDEVYHNVFSVSPAKRFDLGKYPPRAVNQVTFDRVGLVNLYCDIHPGMAAYVMVLPHRVFTRPTRSGDFVLPDLPAGGYELRVWHPSQGDLRRQVTVPKGGRGVNVTLAY